LYSVNVMSASKPSLQELNQLIGIKLLTSSFPEFFGSWSQFPGRVKFPFWQHPCGRPRSNLAKLYTRIDTAHKVRKKTFNILLCTEVQQTF